MKLVLNPMHESLLRDFKLYLKVLGYRGLHRSNIAVRELLNRMEVEGKSIALIRSEDLKLHYEYLLERPNYKRAGGLSLRTITEYFFMIRLFFIYVEKLGMLEVNPVSGLNDLGNSLGNSLKEEKVVLTKNEIAQLYAVSKTAQERCILGLFYGCGLRKSEGEKLNVKDVDFRGKLLYVRSGKGRKRRVIPLSETVMNDFKSYRFTERIYQETRWTSKADEGAFMLNKKGTRMRGKSYWIYFKNLLSRTPINQAVSLHHLRHTIATHLLSEGMKIEQVRDFLGHECLESTQIYTRVKSAQLKLN